MSMKVYQQLAKACGAYHRCVRTGNTEWEHKWKALLDEILEQFPSGSGFDSGTKLVLDESHDEILIFTTSFHHMNEDGMYDGWTEHTVKVVPSLGLDYHVKVSGKDRNQIKEYIAEQFSYELSKDVVEEPIAA